MSIERSLGYIMPLTCELARSYIPHQLTQPNGHLLILSLLVFLLSVWPRSKANVRVGRWS
jgi:hypothetical protein